VWTIYNEEDGEEDKYEAGVHPDSFVSGFVTKAHPDSDSAVSWRTSPCRTRNMFDSSGVASKSLRATTVALFGVTAAEGPCVHV
jgi:hypothetical protein